MYVHVHIHTRYTLTAKKAVRNFQTCIIACMSGALSSVVLIVTMHLAWIDHTTLAEHTLTTLKHVLCAFQYSVRLLSTCVAYTSIGSSLSIPVNTSMYSTHE